MSTYIRNMTGTFAFNKMESKLKTRNGISKKIILKTPDVDYTPDPGGMGVVFFNKMQSYGQAIAQVDALTGEKDSYACLLQRAIRTAIKMRSLGLTSNDIITICSINHLNSCVPFIGALFLGVKIANLDPSLSLNDTVFLLKQVHPKLIFVGEEAITLIEEVLAKANMKSKIVVFGTSSKYLQFSSFLLPSVAESYFMPVKVFSYTDTAVIFFSSGTTGLPKGICLSHCGLLGRAQQLCNLGLPMGVTLNYASLYWISPTVFLISSILSKGCRLIAPNFNPSATWNLVAKYKVTLLFIAPIQAIYLSKLGLPPNIDISSLKVLAMGGGPISKELIMQLRDMLPGIYVIMGYGQTETCGVTTVFNLQDPDHIRCLKEKPESSGKVLDGMIYKVVDPETEETLGPYEKGELRVKSKFLMNGYYNMDSSDAWDDEGFLRTGDVVYYDDDYCLYIIDRVKELLKFQMWHVPPAIIEGVLLTHPAVQSAVVIGLPHPIDGDHPMGAVVLKKSYINKVTPEEIQEFVDQKVDDRQKLRGGVKIVDQIPCTPSGKLKRAYIKDLAMRGEI